MSTILNPLTQRKIKVGGAVYNKLIASGVLSAIKKQIAERGTLRAGTVTETNAKKTSRSAPEISATKLPVGTERLGQDGIRYIIQLRANGTQFWAKCTNKTAKCSGEQNEKPQSHSTKKKKNVNFNLTQNQIKFFDPQHGGSCQSKRNIAIPNGFQQRR
jgi:hypothetical protein